VLFSLFEFNTCISVTDARLLGPVKEEQACEVSEGNSLYVSDLQNDNLDAIDMSDSGGCIFPSLTNRSA
jgi:hypothetical protein